LSAQPSVDIRFIERADYRIAVHIAENREGVGDLVLLHGAGVASEATWYPMLATFQSYRRVICPDLRGMGQSHAIDFEDRSITANVVADDVDAILDELSVRRCQMVGYSFGGLIALMVNVRNPGVIDDLVLLEPALLERSSLEALRELRSLYLVASVSLLTEDDPIIGVTQFLDLISPNRSTHPRVEHMTVQRLASRPKGLAYSLMAVNDAVWNIDRMELIDQAPRTLSLVGSKTVDDAHAFHQILAASKEKWFYQSVPGVDHALPYQKPGVCAELICAHFGR
jgi:pimeloyl-ACP methyl ester carboxylesterase